MQTAYAVYENGVLRPTAPLSDLQEGQRVLVTVQLVQETGPEESASREAEFIRRMEAEGMLEHFPAPTEPPPADWQPLVLEGEPLSETIIKMRGEK